MYGTDTDIRKDKNMYGTDTGRKVIRKDKNMYGTDTGRTPEQIENEYFPQ